MSTMNDVGSLGVAGLTDPAVVGRGGFGVVYAATEQETGRRVAVKVLDAVTDHRQQARFDAECQAMATLSHLPYIARIERWGRTDDDRPFLVMEYLPGGSLADRLRVGGPLLPERVRMLGDELAMALAAAHRVGIVHRDVKPENVLLDAEGHAKLTDFGIAVVTGMTAGTTTGTLVASFAHVAPELLDGARPTPLVDVYSLGSTLVTLLTGQPPFQVDGDNPSQMLARVLQGLLPDLRAYGVPEDLDALLRRAMARDPQQRTPSAEQFGAELRGSVAPPTGFASTPVIAPAVPQDAPVARRRRSLVLAATLGLLTLIAAVAGVVLARGSGSQPEVPSTNTSVVIPQATAGSTLVDLRSVDWKNRTYPGTCADDPGKPHSAQVKNGAAVSNGMNVAVSTPVYGDVSGDGQPEAAVEMECTSASGGNQNWSRAYVFAPGPSAPVLAGELGDANGGIGPEKGSTFPSSVQKLTVSNGTLNVMASAYSSTAAHCCPDMTVLTGWQIQNGKLTRTSRQVSYVGTSESDTSSSGTNSTEPTAPTATSAPTASSADSPCHIGVGTGCYQDNQRIRSDAGSVNIRSEPSRSSDIVATVNGGQTVKAGCMGGGDTLEGGDGSSDMWVGVDLGSGFSGWIIASVFEDTSTIQPCD